MNLKPKFVFQAQRIDFERVIQLHFGYRNADDSIDHVKEIVFERLSNNSDIPAGTGLQMSNAEAQSLLDSLYRLGLRPSDSIAAPNQLKATQEHLAHANAMLDTTLGIVIKLAESNLPHP